MNSTEFKHYGLVGGELQIKAYIAMACKVISPNTQKEASLLLAETIATESDNGRAWDYSEEHGEGLTQFDRETFDDIKSHYSRSKHSELLKRIRTFLGVNIMTAQYEDLRKSPMLAIVMARLLYLRVPYAIPSSKIGRWQYYKTHFNSFLGETTESKYMTASKVAVYQDSNNQVV